MDAHNPPALVRASPEETYNQAVNLVDGNNASAAGLDATYQQLKTNFDGLPAPAQSGLMGDALRQYGASYYAAQLALNNAAGAAESALSDLGDFGTSQRNYLANPTQLNASLCLSDAQGQQVDLLAQYGYQGSAYTNISICRGFFD